MGKSELFQCCQPGSIGCFSEGHRQSREHGPGRRGTASELRTICYGLRQMVHSMENEHIFLMTDNVSTKSFLNKKERTRTGKATVVLVRENFQTSCVTLGKLSRASLWTPFPWGWALTQIFPLGWILIPLLTVNSAFLHKHPCEANGLVVK